MTSITTHNSHLSKAGLPSMATLERRILGVFDRATASDVEAGATWYDEAQSLAVELGRTSGHGTAVAAAVISHLSPRTTWARNVAGAITLLTYGERADGVIGANYDRARSALVSADPVETFGGNKTRRFYLNISGDTEAVTVDVWALRVVGLDDSTIGRKGVYEAIEAAYQRAARRVGVSPSTMQATTWVVARNGRAS